MTTRSATRFALIVIGALMLVAIAALMFNVRRLQRNVERVGLRADSAAAASDTSRRLMLAARDSARLLGDSLTAVERRAVQLPRISRDDLDRATDRTSSVRTAVAITPGAIRTAAGSSSATADSVGTRSATFRVDSSAATTGLQYVADVGVSIPTPPAPATMTLDVRFRPIALGARLQCGAPDDVGIRPASIVVTAPIGVTASVGASAVDVHACNPDYGRPRGIRVPLSVVGALVGVTAVVTAVLVAR